MVSTAANSSYSAAGESFTYGATCLSVQMLLKICIKKLQFFCSSHCSSYKVFQHNDWGEISAGVSVVRKGTFLRFSCLAFLFMKGVHGF